MFDSHGTERLAEWKKIRDTLEKADDPFALVCQVWSKAPFVNQYIDPCDQGSWPDPWHLILDSKFDNLAIVLGMLYTLQLTGRFSNEDYTIYMIQNLSKNPEFCLQVSDTCVLNLEYGGVSSIENLKKFQTNIIYNRIMGK